MNSSVFRVVSALAAKWPALVSGLFDVVSKVLSIVTLRCGRSRTMMRTERRTLRRLCCPASSSECAISSLRKKCGFLHRENVVTGSVGHIITRYCSACGAVIHRYSARGRTDSRITM